MGWGETCKGFLSSVMSDSLTQRLQQQKATSFQATSSALAIFHFVFRLSHGVGLLVIKKRLVI